MVLKPMVSETLTSEVLEPIVAATVFEGRDDEGIGRQMTLLLLTTVVLQYFQQQCS